MAVTGRARALAMLASFLLASCGSTASPAPSTSVSSAPAPASVSPATRASAEATPSPLPSALAAVSGPSGGTVRLPDGAMLLVPAEATIGKTQATISMQPAPVEPPSAAWPERAVGPAYRLDLGGAALAKPVTVTLPFDAAALSPGVIPEELVLAYHDDTAGRWVAVPSSVDVSRGTVSAKVSHLSVWALWAPDWDYWLALLKSAASGNLTEMLHAVTTFGSGCNTTDPVNTYTVDNSAANRMVQGCLTKTSNSGATLEIRNLRAFALEVSDPRGYIPKQPVLLSPGDAVSFGVAVSDPSPVIVEANMSVKGLTASVVEIVLDLLPNISAAHVSKAWRPAFREIVDQIGQLHALSDAISEADAGQYPQAAEAAVKAISGIEFLTTLATAAHAAGVKYGIPALAQVDTAGLQRVMLVVGLGDLIVTTWSFFGDYFFNAHTEVHLTWKLQPPAAPMKVTFTQDWWPTDPNQVVGSRDAVSWRGSFPAGTMVAVYGVTRCFAAADAPDGTPCVTSRSPISGADLLLLGRVPATRGRVTWNEYFGAGCQWARTMDTNVELVGIVVWAENAGGRSPVVVAGTARTHSEPSVC